MNDDIKSIAEQMLESGMNQEEINSFILETFDIDLSEESTTVCSECNFGVRRKQCSRKTCMIL